MTFNTVSTQLTNSGYNSSPAWGRNSEELLYVHQEVEEITGEILDYSELYLINIVSGDSRSFFNNAKPLVPVDHKQPEWSPSRDRIVFLAQAANLSTETYNMYTVNEDGTEMQQYLGKQDIEQSYYKPRWLPNGEGIIFQHQFSDMLCFSTIPIDEDSTTCTSLTSFFLYSVDVCEVK